MAEFLTLSNGVRMPIVGLGTFQSAPGEIEDAVRIALNNGYRHIDTAAAYQNEGEIGSVIKEFLSSGKIKRKDLFITTKLFWIFNKPEEVEGALQDQLAKLQLDYVDLYLIHMPVTYDHTMTKQDPSVKVTDTWKAMEQVYEKKLARAIGVSNFNAEQIARVQKMAKIPIHNNQIEMHLYFNQKKLQEVCKKHNITVTAYCPLGAPGRKDLPFPNGYVMKFDPAPSNLENPAVLKLAKKYNKSAAQILLRHLIEQGVCVIPKSVTEKRIKENIQVFDFQLTKEEIEELNDAPQGKRLHNMNHMIGHPEDPIIDERQK